MNNEKHPLVRIHDGISLIFRACPKKHTQLRTDRTDTLFHRSTEMLIINVITLQFSDQLLAISVVSVQGLL